MTSSRRTFVQSLIAAGSGVAIAPLCVHARTWERSARHAMNSLSYAPGAAVLSFHMDQPYLGRSDTCRPYHPPAGTQSARALAALSEAELRSCLWAS